MAKNGSGWHWSKAQVAEISARLTFIRKKTGAVTSRAVIDDARDPGSPLHQFFDWDDSSAAEKFRLHQAGQLIQRVQVIVKTPTGDPVSYTHLRAHETPEHLVCRLLLEK